MSPGFSSELPSITVANKEFDFENERFAFRTNSTKSAFKKSSILDSSFSTSTIDFANKRNFNDQNKTIIQNSLVSALKHSKIPNTIQTQTIQTNNKNILLHSTLIAVEEIRNSLNERLNHLINQINIATSDIKLINKSDKNILSLKRNTKHYTTLKPIGIVESTNIELDLQQIKSQQRPHTPLSLKTRSVSPSRVSFSSVQTTFRDED